MPRHQSAIRLPHSAITLTEVLIAMGILTLGLLGVAAMFPVAGYYMRKGDVADRASAVAQAAFNDVVARGMLNPENWYVMVPSGTDPSVDSPKYHFKADPASTAFQTIFYRCVPAALAESLAITTEPFTSMQLGSAYVLDPMGIASFAMLQKNPANRLGYSFPATANSATLPVSVYSSYSSAWSPWNNADNTEDTWPIRRVTFHQPSFLPGLPGGEPMQAAAAARLFSGHDDLVIDMPDRDDLPSIQNWELLDTDNDKVPDTPLARQSRDDYSWIVTVVPKTIDARNALASSGDGQAYDVSVVVFYKRVLARTDPIVSDPSGDVSLSKAASDLLMRQERSVHAKVVSKGLSGGELLLTAYDSNTSHDDGLGSPFTQLKAGEWIMLCGPHPDSSAENPRFVLNWYRVLSIEGKDAKLDQYGNPTKSVNEPERRLVAVRGPEWPWEPYMTYSSSLSNWLCAAICPGAVAVHNKTIRLESNTPWSIE